MFPQFLGEVVQIWSADRPGRETRLGDDLRHRPMCQQSPVGDVGQAVTSFCFVHIVGRNQECQAVGSEFVNLLPEFTPRFRIHSGSRFIEQQQLRLMDQAGCQCKPLLPAAR